VPAAKRLPCRSSHAGLLVPGVEPPSETMAPSTTAPGDATTPVGRIRPRVLVGPLAAWVVLTAAALVVGWLRDLIFLYLGGYTSHVFATQAVVGIVVAVAWLYFSRTALTFSRAELALVGACWTVATVGLDAVLGAVGPLGPYRVLLGPVWYLVVLALLLVPPLVGWWLAGDG